MSLSDSVKDDRLNVFKGLREGAEFVFRGGTFGAHDCFARHREPSRQGIQIPSEEELRGGIKCEPGVEVLHVNRLVRGSQ